MNNKNKHRVRAKKHLGQHFLTDMDIAQKIADSVSDKYPVLEIGPGMGVLTKFLIRRQGIDLRVIELDRESVAYLNENFPELRSRILSGDFLKLDLNELYQKPFAVIGNLPYNISSQIFFKVLENRDKVPELVGMIQKEVAQRIASAPKCKEYGILSVLLQAYYDIEYLFTVHEHVFSPPPKVKSAVIRITRNDRQSLGCNEKLFKQVVKATFNQRRKAIRNSIKMISFNREAVIDHPLMGKRPEHLSVEEFVQLTKLVEDHPVKND